MTETLAARKQGRRAYGVLAREGVGRRLSVQVHRGSIVSPVGVAAMSRALEKAGVRPAPARTGIDAHDMSVRAGLE